ncbi:MAG: hypothetical protein KC502_21090 [Myxococcales bacterium]|nr:hypothetical protein [Myxococcales bacterium]
MSEPKNRSLSQTASHVFVALLAVLAVLAWQAWSNRDQGGAASSASSQDVSHGAQPEEADGSALSAPAPVTNGQDNALPSPIAPPTAAAPVKITAAPASLRVWHNTRVVLEAEPGPEADFTRYVWHFEDGSNPAEGAKVTHVFPESVTDRHITLEAHRTGSTPLVISKRLPIERLLVAPVDGTGDLVRPVPKPRGLRVAFIGAGAALPNDQMLSRLLKLKVAAFVIVGSAPAAGGAAQTLTKLDSPAPVLHLDTALASPEVPLPDVALKRAPLTVVRDPLGRVTHGAGAGVWVLDHVAFVPHDSRPLASNEAAMLALQRALQVASAYPSIAMLSARPLSPLIDHEQVADRAFRIYEHALRSNVAVAVSASSGVAYDGRYGGLGAVSVGQTAPHGCARLAGTDHCQRGTVTLIDLPKKGGSRTLHLRLPSLSAWLDTAVLPSSVGKYRR